jgi:hypothetical protein
MWVKYLEDGGSTFPRKFCKSIPSYILSHLRKYYFPFSYVRVRVRVPKYNFSPFEGWFFSLPFELTAFLWILVPHTNSTESWWTQSKCEDGKPRQIFAVVRLSIWWTTQHLVACLNACICLLHLIGYMHFSKFNSRLPEWVVWLSTDWVDGVNARQVWNIPLRSRV